jgi:hypothetical protein
MAQMEEQQRIEISVKGKWTTVPTLYLCGKNVVVRGKWLKIARVHAEEWSESELANPELCVNKLKHMSNYLPADIFTFTQMLPANEPKYNYPVVWDSVAVARTRSFQEWWEGLPQESRKNVRRSQKRGVVVKVQKIDDELIRNIVVLNNDCPIRQGRLYTHYGKSFDEVKRDQASFSERSNYVCAYAGEELIGFLKLVHRGKVASILQILPKLSQQDKRPANALVSKTVELCAAKGVEYLTYGQFNYGNKHHSPLREFKVRNGFKEICMPRYYVPLTLWGACCLKTNVHLGALGILPHWIINLGVDLRTRWYNRKFDSSRCSSMPERPNRNRQMECSNPPAGSTSARAEYNVTEPPGPGSS